MKMRLPYFRERCEHVRGQIIRVNGGRFYLDHYLKVLRARAEADATVIKPFFGIPRLRPRKPEAA